MSQLSDKQRFTKLLASVGITVNGTKPYDIQVHDERLYSRVMSDISLGAGESYMDGWWDCEQLDELFYRIMRFASIRHLYNKKQIVWFFLRNLVSNLQSHMRSKRVAEQHYDISSELYQAMLGPSMTYSCAYWRNANNLDEAQYAKYDLICRKLNVQKGETILELGCGFGGFAKYAAEHYGAEVTGVNISQGQMAFAKQHCVGLPIHLYITDYRNQHVYNPEQKRFNHVVSIGMFEHIGHKNYNVFLQTALDQIQEDGKFVLHTIGKNTSTVFADPWIQKHIFPGGYLPSVKRIAAAAERRFVVEDLHNFGADYDKTLMAWENNFVNAWPQLKADYDERFYRMWRYYLCSCAGSFRARDIQLWQWVFSPQGELGGHKSIR